MSRYIATRAIRGANLLVNEADTMLSQALAQYGPDKAGRHSPTRPTTCRSSSA